MPLLYLGRVLLGGGGCCRLAHPLPCLSVCLYLRPLTHSSSSSLSLSLLSSTHVKFLTSFSSLLFFSSFLTLSRSSFFLYLLPSPFPSHPRLSPFPSPGPVPPSSFIPYLFVTLPFSLCLYSLPATHLFQQRHPPPFPCLASSVDSFMELVSFSRN